MLAIIATNLLRRSARTVFTASGIAVGVATIVALLSFTQGLKETAAGFVHLGGSDLGVFQANVSDPTASVLPGHRSWGAWPGLPEVARATPLLLIVEGVKADPAAIVFGAEPSGFFSRGLVLTAGQAPAARPQGRCSLGDRLAAQLHLRPRRTLTIKGQRPAGRRHLPLGHPLRGLRRRLALAPGTAARRPPRRGHRRRRASSAPGTRAGSAAASIERAFPGTQVITDPQQALRAGANSTLISKAILVIVVIALIVGAISVANTMAMSIIERQAELGLLSTVGWSPLRVASLILGEGVAVSVLGAAAGPAVRGDRRRPAGPGARRQHIRLAVGHRLGPRTGPARGCRDRRARRHLPRVAGDPHDAPAGAVGAG